MKAVVLARGAGKRMREADPASRLTAAQQAAASAGHKALMPVGEGPLARPFLDYVLSELADAGCEAVCLVVGPDPDPVRAHYTAHPPRRLRLSFAVQPQPDGTAGAVLAAEAFAGDDPFLVLNSDNVYPAGVLRELAALDGPGLPAYTCRALVSESGFPRERVAAFALLDVDGAGRLRAILEKPGAARVEAAGPDALVSMNVWRFDRRIFEACRDVPRSARGEYELPEAVGLSLGRGVAYQVVPGRGAVIDLSRRGDVPHVAERLAGREAHP
jgi:glucose-1-phosphate thymidylyltransferase